MLRIVSNNDEQAKIEAVGYRHISLSAEERGLVLDRYDENSIVPVTQKWHPYTERFDHLDLTLRPALKRFSKGPFHLRVSNQGKSLQGAFLVFDLLQAEQKEDVAPEGIIKPDSHDWVTRSITAIPFMSVFQREIVREAEHAEKLIRRSKVVDLGKRKAQDDASLVFQATEHFLSALKQEGQPQDTDKDKAPPKPTIGREAVTDGLASTLSASHAFYDSVWNSMIDFYSPSFRHLGERIALGEISTRAPEPIRL